LSIWQQAGRGAGRRISLATIIAKSQEGDEAMADDTKVYPTGLTPAEANEIQAGLMWGTRIYAGIAIFAHILAYMLTPWLK
jgi:light-harvesting protein B-800-850 beta chain